MKISKENWDVHEIDYDEFRDASQELFTIGIAPNYPKQYFLLSERYSGFKMLIEQSFIGLHTVPYVSFIHKSQTLLCLTDFCVVIDYKKKTVLLQQKLNTSCIDILCINDMAYIVCEADIMKYSVEDNALVKSLYLSDTVQEITNQNGEWMIALYDGTLITLPFSF